MNYKFCPHCGHKIDADATFCPNCGYKIGQYNSNNNQFQQTTNNYQYSRPERPQNYRPNPEYIQHSTSTRPKPFSVVWNKFSHNLTNYNGCTNRSDFNKIAIILIIVAIIIDLLIPGRAGLELTRVVVYLGGALAIRRAHDAGMSTGCATTLFILFGLLFDIAMMFPGSHNYSNGKFKQRAINKGYPPVI